MPAAVESLSYRTLDTADSGSQHSTVPLDRSLLIRGDAADGLRMLPDRCIQTVVTSPPYWSLRDYGVVGQTGHDDTLDDYLTSVVTVLAETRRVLTDTGTVWLNIGDSYTSGNRRSRAPDPKNPHRAMTRRPPTPDGLKPKDLIGVPWRLAFALQDAGWWLRSNTIWHKPNAHPESVRDRPTKAHETVFLLSKNHCYFYDPEAVRGPNGRRLRTVWDIPTEPQRQIGAACVGSGVGSSVDLHPAVMPTALAERCIQLTSRTGDTVLDPYAGSGTTLVSAQRHRRRWVGIELNPSFVRMAKQRLTENCSPGR